MALILLTYMVCCYYLFSSSWQHERIAKNQIMHFIYIIYTLETLTKIVGRFKGFCFTNDINIVLIETKKNLPSFDSQKESCFATAKASPFVTLVDMDAFSGDFQYRPKIALVVSRFPDLPS